MAANLKLLMMHTKVPWTVRLQQELKEKAYALRCIHATKGWVTEEERPNM